jgi:hypothetical protein
MYLKDTIYFLPDKVKEEELKSKSLLLVLRTSDYAAEGAQKTLAGIVKAIGYDMEKDVQLILLNANEKKLIGDQIPTIKNMVFFGLNPKEIGIHLDAKLYKIYKFDSFQLSISHKLEDITKDQKLKQILWKVLQVQFLTQA